MCKLFLKSPWDIKEKSGIGARNKIELKDVITMKEEKGGGKSQPYPYIMITGYDKGDLSIHAVVERTARLIKSSPDMYKILDGILSCGSVDNVKLNEIRSLLDEIV